MYNSNTQSSPALRKEAASCFFISLKKHDHSESTFDRLSDYLPAHYMEYLLLLRLILLIHINRRTPRGLYEIARTPGEGDKHTLYFKGLYGDIFSQMTRNDAQLVTSASTLSFPKSLIGNLSFFKSSNSLEVAKSPDLFELAKSAGVFPFAKGDTFPPNFKGVTVNTNKADIEALEMSTSATSFFCQDIAGSCSEYYLNTAKYYYLQSAYKVARVVYSVEYDVFVWMMLVVVIALTPYFIPIGLFSLSIPSPFVRKEMLSGRGGYNNKSFITENSGEGDSWFAKRTLSVTPLLTVAILFTFTQCGIIGGGKKKGDAPWLLLASGVNSNTPSVDSPSNSNSSGGSGGSGGSALVPVVGMYFLHPDHLGSIKMITDGRGNVIAGGNNGGKSHISYKPYGEIHRTDSSGPDITRFKYTGQEEDKESGLMYYKARYYDPMIGRFLQADSMAFPDRIMGMNRYMYVEGNPVKWSDRSGNKLSTSQGFMLMGYLAGPQHGMSQGEGLAWGAVAGRRATIDQKRERGFIYRNSQPFKWYDGSDLQRAGDYVNTKVFGKYYKWRDRNAVPYRNTTESKILIGAWYIMGQACKAVEDEKAKTACYSNAFRIFYMFYSRAEANYDSNNAFRGRTNLDFKGSGDGRCSYNTKLGNAATYTILTTGWWKKNENGSGVGYSNGNPNQSTEAEDASQDRAVTDYAGSVAAQEAVCNYEGD